VIECLIDRSCPKATQVLNSMAIHVVTLHLPDTLYERFQQRAKSNHRGLETEILDAIAFAASAQGELSSDLKDSLAALQQLDDDQLWRLAREEVMSLEASQKLEALHLKQRDELLDQEEDAARANLIREYERSMLVRAQAAKLLKDRGHDVSILLAHSAT
jgi:hypothetical protein